MSPSKRVTKKRLLRTIKDLEQRPEDKLRILGDAGIVAVGVGLGAAAAATVAGITGATSVGALTTVASWAGLVTVAATPVGWVLGCALAGGAAAYGISRIIHSGGLSEGRKLELLQKYREELGKIEMKEASGQIAESDRSHFIYSMREIIDKDAISPETAFRLIEQVEAGSIPLSQAIGHLQEILQEEIQPRVSASAERV